MPTRKIEVGGTTWRVYPSGYITQMDLDEFGLIFVSGSGPDATVRVTRYSPRTTRAREQSLAELSDSELIQLLEFSQPSDTSPEAGYIP
jgi:hypothetical protein